MGFLSKVWKKIKKVVGVVAMIAAPFIAAPIAAAIGVSGAIGTALTGAVVGGLGAGAAGVNPLIGAAVGGLGGFVSGGGASGLFGGGARAATGAAGVAGRAAPIAGAAGTGAAGAAGVGAVAPAAAVGLSTAAAPAAGGFLSGLNIGNLAPLAMAMFGKAPQNLTPIEQEALVANAQTSAVERGVFDERLAGARSLLQQGEANPERAYGEAQMATQRGLRDVERTAGISERPGMRESERRRAAIEGARIGTAAVTGEQARAAQATAAGLSALPTEVPTTGSELNMKIYEDLYKRRSDYARDLAGGAGQLYDSYTSNRNQLV
jgi:hypothetical protein